MGNASKDLLHLEELHNPYSSSLESTLRVCENASLTQNKKKPHSEGKPSTASLPTSIVLGRVKDFLGVISDANERLQLNRKENPTEGYNIEVLTGNESEYIEMDLMLGVADLHTPEAVAAAESAVASSQQVISLAASSNGTEPIDISDDDTDSGNEDDNGKEQFDHCNAGSVLECKTSDLPEDHSSIKPKGDHQSSRRSRIVELP